MTADEHSASPTRFVVVCFSFSVGCFARVMIAKNEGDKGGRVREVGERGGGGEGRVGKWEIGG